MALFQSSATSASSNKTGRGSRKGFVWVRQSTADPRLCRLGISSVPPSDTDEDAGEGAWSLQYYALVNDTIGTISGATAFLSSFADLSSALDNVYRTQPVVAATSIETSGADVQFRKSEFKAIAPAASGDIEIDIEDDDLDNAGLRNILEKSIERRQRASQLISQLDEFEQALAYSEEVTGFNSGRKPAPTHDERDPVPVVRAARGPAAQPRDLKNEPKIVLYKDVEPEEIVPLDGPDQEAMRRMERLILRREASQNLREIHHGYLMSFLQGVPLGALIGVGIVLLLNLPAETEVLLRFVIAGTCAVPLTLFGIRVIRNWNRSQHWRRILRT